MGDDITGNLASLVVLLVLSALFSSTETAITATSRAKLTSLQERHPILKRFYSWLMNDTQGALTATLVANNLINIAASALATTISVRLFGNQGVLYAIIGMTTLIVIFGEIFPKSVAIIRSEHILFFTLPVLRLTYLVFLPILWGLTKIVRFLGILTRIDLSPQHTFVTREEVEQLVRMGEASGALETEERRMIHGIISFEETRACEIMVPRMDMVAISSERTIHEAVAVFQEYGHSRIPVFEEGLDKISGILYVKDIIGALSGGRMDAHISEIQRVALFVPEVVRTSELFELMKRERTHMAIVVDEYGGTAGLITLEDLLEEIVGEIQDEYDQEAPAIQKESESSYLAEGYVNLEELSERLGYSFQSEDVDSLGGLILSLTGRFPEKGNIVYYGPWVIEVLEVEDHRIKLLRLQYDEDRFQSGENAEKE